MDIHFTDGTEPEPLALNLAELQEINGGYMRSPVDISEMPDRSVMCGTMWYLGQLLGRFTGMR